MSSIVVYPPFGRGAWSIAGVGGTLDAKGLKKGPYYRAPAVGQVEMPGLRAALALRNNRSVDVNDLAVFYAVKVLQQEVGAVDDGILGPRSESAIKKWQSANRLVPDGIPGPKTFRAMLESDVRSAARKIDSKIEQMLVGHVGHESGWDPGAVGYTTPHDLGLCQISGVWHPSLNEEFRLTPSKSIPWAAEFVAENLDYMKGDVDAGILAYNLGRGGATQWVKAGRPQWFYKVDTYAYIASVKKWMGPT